MARQLEMEVANLVCRFGEQKVLIDFLDDIVIPAFFVDEERANRGNDYYFTGQQFVYLKRGDIDSLALTCRFIKSTILTRHQTYSRNDGLIKDEKSLPSAPSALAALLLKSHRLLYLREVPNAPAPSTFGTTFVHFMKRIIDNKRNDHIIENMMEGRRISKASAAEQYPYPDLRVVPVVSQESLKEFINRFDSLNTVKIEVAPTNNELDNNKFFKLLRSSKSSMNSTRTVVQHHNSQGLDKESTLEHVEAAKQGNAFVQMKGKDASGDDLVGDNNNFSVRAIVDTDTDDPDRSIKDLYERYEGLIQEDVINVGQSLDDITGKLKSSYNRFLSEDS